VVHAALSREESRGRIVERIIGGQGFLRRCSLPLEQDAQRPFSGVLGVKAIDRQQDVFAQKLGTSGRKAHLSRMRLHYWDPPQA